MKMRIIFLCIGTAGLLATGPALAMSFDELMNSMLGRTETPAAATAAVTAPAAPAPSVTAIPQSQPVPAVVPAPAATPVETKPILTAGGSCGFLGQVFGCPEGGIQAPPNLPEFNHLLRSLTAISAVDPNTKEGKLDLIRLGNRLGKINPAALHQQMKVFAEASPAERVGAVRLLELPMMNVKAMEQPFETMEAFLLDASGKGERLNSNMKAANNLLKQLAEQVDDPSAREELAGRVANMEGILKAGTVGAAAKKAVSPFYKENGTPMTNPKNGKQTTTQQVAIAVTMMSLEDGFDFGQNDAPIGAMTRRQANSTLDDF